MSLFDDLVREVCNETRDMLIAKNRQYGNSVLEPVRVFSKADRIEQIKVRIDDKISRLARCPAGEDMEDTARDLLGYLIILEVARRQGDLRPQSVGKAEDHPTISSNESELD